MPYTPHTEQDIRAMLDAVGLPDVEDLFAAIPAAVRARAGLGLPASLSEEEVWRVMSNLAAFNVGQDELVSFMGGGVYDTYIPAAVDALSSRSEFLTAYTPYQPEVSQGTLQVIYEWQTFVSRLTGLPVANASLYDGATALVEALLMALAKTGRGKVILPETLNPRYRRVVETYLKEGGADILTAPRGADGATDPAGLAGLVDETTAAVVLQTPNYLGRLEPVDELAAALGASGALLIALVNPVSLSVVRPPASYGASIVVGEAQPFGIPCSWGGPLLGFLACTEDLKRQIPGRVAGRTVDSKGRTGYVLTLQTREQHIRREKATSNICTNQGLNMTRAAITLALLGAEGFKALGEANLKRAAALRAVLGRIDGPTFPCEGPVFNELVVRLPGSASAFAAFARGHGVLAGIPLDGFAGCGAGDLLVAVTERRTADEIETYGNLVRDYLEARGDD
ncbi:aminomethyl-transferring glycine dehydrogenase subunit GcvPA [bacterium]|nr:aminomethyl-transferring glycine dehydrogenase subunit GcvPA [bacterium]MBU1074364.1 aminomethyl-transferring glycine dehydrogenase subunit GcvPA [bacterium]MBU1675271.1 aminomethyl-transferring glycine dehydrogenase subunit GcvPA [bacterium]